MDPLNSLPFFPRRLFLQGLIVLGTSALVAGAVGFSSTAKGIEFPEENQSKKENRSSPPFKIDLGLKRSGPCLPLPSLRDEIVVFFDSPRPDRIEKEISLRIHLKKSGLSKRCTVPCRVDLRYAADGQIEFCEEASLFWLELTPLSNREIQAKVYAQGISEESAAFILPKVENPLFTVHELSETSPFRLLAESGWWGRDVFSEKYGNSFPRGERIEVGPRNACEIIELQEGDWMAWDEGKWKKIPSLLDSANKWIVRIESVKEKELILEGWDFTECYRFAIPLVIPFPLKGRPEELITAIRVRSDKQISCMIEKQCLILKTGDWVFKGDGRWRILRKKEDREAFLSGKLVGEIFVFEKIETKQGQKMIQGHLFNLSRSQSLFVDLPAQSMKAGGKLQERKLRIRPR